MRIIRNPKNNPYWIVITVFLLIFLMVGVLCLQYYKGLQSTCLLYTSDAADEL